MSHEPRPNDTSTAPPKDSLNQLATSPRQAMAAARVILEAAAASEPKSFLATSLPVVASALASPAVAVVRAMAGRWTTLSTTDPQAALPIDLAAEALDREATATSDDWLALPLDTPHPRTDRTDILLLNRVATATSELQAIAKILAWGLATAGDRQRQRRRVEQLEAILQIAGQWNRNPEVESLLAEMAEAATRLLDADRASIFLWDRRNHTLVGRPALGIEGGELRVPDDRGVVGEVIQSGEPRRVDATVQPKAIDRQVDVQLHYQTQTLLCVPLRGRSGELFGAFELINKHSGSFTEDDQAALVELAGHAAIALENARDRQRLLSTNRQIADQAAEGVRMIGDSPAIEALRSIVHRVADTDLAVLILGENGTGKEVVAQRIHYLSRRREQPFVAINCAAIPDTLAESELFGHEKGAFTDAKEARPGKFELAAGGTLFLDEIGDLSLSGQAKLLRVLEEKVLVRVGGSTPISTDARVLAATNQNLAELVRQRKFREDLYFRLNVVTLDLPPLRDRGDDVLLLAEHFLRDFCAKARRAVPRFSTAAGQRLRQHAWPGNVRELRNLMERLAYLSSSEEIGADELAFILAPRSPDASDTITNIEGPLSDATAEFQVRYIRQAIDHAGGNMSRAADALGLHRSNLYRKMRQLAMEPTE